MRRWQSSTLTAVAIGVSMILAASACSSGAERLAPTTSGGPLPPTSSPGVTGAVDEGQASIAVREDLMVDAAFDRLGAPAIWKPSPGGMALNWLAPGGSTFGLSGQSFEGTMQTGSRLRLELEIREGGEAVSFRSDDGSCSVTIERALAMDLSGTFACADLESIDGTLRVDATGTFTATG
jgi:hypothetical protein